jgi:integrase
MKLEGYRDSTIRTAVKALRSIGRRCNLLDPNALTDYMAKAEYSENRSDHILDDARRFFSWLHVEFTKPMSRRVQKFPFIPTEAEVNALTSAVGPKLSANMRLVRETEARAGEIWQLQWTDVDPNTGTITINPEKGSRPKRPKIIGSAMASVLALPRASPFVFHRPDADPEISYQHFFRNYAKQRAKIAIKLQNPRLRSISFKTLRHFKATIEYHRTKDILHVMEILSHKNIRNTLMYTHLVNWESDEFVSKVATSQKEITELIEAGFGFILQTDGLACFIRRK